MINRINSDTLLSGTYEKLVKLLDNYNPAVTIADEPVAVEVQEQREFLDELFKTDIIRDTVVSPLESAACIYLKISGGS